jgi:ethanolamine-phosphate cytidylyltransferase/choline-phosphate cytidylyltransferase
MKILLSLLLTLCFANCTAQESRPVRVYVDITGDLFHAGHVEFLKKAKAFGDVLIVGVLEDDTVESYKRRPVLTLEERTTVIAACRYVDEVISPVPLRLTKEMVEELQIDYVIHGDDFNVDTVRDQYAVALDLGIFRSVPYTAGISTSDIISRISMRHELGEFPIVRNQIRIQQEN